MPQAACWARASVGHVGSDMAHLGRGMADGGLACELASRARLARADRQGWTYIGGTLGRALKGFGSRG